MKKFVAIKTLFGKDSERTLDHLSSLYSDISLLRKTIEDITSEYLTRSIISEKKILLKPNWVKHNSTSSDEVCLRTHDQFLLAALEVVLSKNPGRVIIGDAPIQGCNWDKMVSKSFADEVANLSEKYRIPVEILDFRRVTFDPSLNNPIRERRPISDYIIFDLAKESYLEPISRFGKTLFRVTNYNPDRLAESHRPGIHKYCIAKELFDADVVISLPKVKTHQKAGITAALKNLVGINGDKDYLPHHRLGGTGFGGDCYPGKNLLRYGSELALDFANRRQGKLMYWTGYKLASLLWRLSLPGPEHDLSAAWHGNDTTWRMVLDLNKIAVLGKLDGTLSTIPQRQVYSLCDGIIGGQGDGPLKPEPLALGIVCFTNQSAIADVCLATLMGFNPDAIPMLKAAKLSQKNNDTEIVLNNQQTNISALKNYSIKAIPPPGWSKYLKNRN